MSDTPLYKDNSQPITDRVEDLLTRMSVEEKVAQLRSQMILRPETSKRRDYTTGHIRSLTHFSHRDGSKTPTECAEINNADIKRSIEASRHGIPVLVNEEALHGAQWGDATCFPQSMALAAMWDEELMAQVAGVIALELKVVNVHQVFSPVINIGRDSRWGRTQETYGEDVYLTSRMGLAYVKTLEEMNIITTPKHFVDNYGEGGRDSNVSNTSWRSLREVYMEPFRVCVEEGGARGIMPAYNSVDGVPCTCSKKLLTDILRDEWGFKGIVVSDYGAVEGVAGTHRVAVDNGEALARSMEAGLDVQLPNSGDELQNLVDSTKLSMETLDASVRRVLSMKFELGLFDKPYVESAEADKVVRCKKHRALALESARKSVVLLKNEKNTLPLAKTAKQIGVFGPAHNTVNLGGYSGAFGGWKGDAITPLEGLSNLAPEGSEMISCTEADDVGRVASDCDVAIYFATIREDEGSDRSNLDLPCLDKDDKQDEIADAGHAIIVDKREKNFAAGDQEGEILAIAESGTPLVVVLVAGSAVTMERWQDKASAIVLPWYGGELSGTAIAEVLFGLTNPGGKLPLTFPKNVGQLPLHYNYKPTGRGYAYNDNDGKANFAFGFGLSYSSFEYSNLVITPEQTSADQPVSVSATIRNASEIAGDEVVQLYIHDSVASVAVPVKQLSGFKRISLDPGEEQTVTFTLDESHLALWNSSMQRVVEPGEFEIMVGSSSEDIRLEGILTIEE